MTQDQAAQMRNPVGDDHRNTAKSTSEASVDTLRARNNDSGMSGSGMSATATMDQKLKSAGVDTEQMMSVAKETATDLQRLLGEEVRHRPLRALGVAAAIGLVFGMMTRR